MFTYPQTAEASVANTVAMSTPKKAWDVARVLTQKSPPREKITAHKRINFQNRLSVFPTACL
jgi:hypothetical protein